MWTMLRKKLKGNDDVGLPEDMSMYLNCLSTESLMSIRVMHAGSWELNEFYFFPHRRLEDKEEGFCGAWIYHLTNKAVLAKHPGYH